MSLKSFLTKLQHKPEAVRVRILWAVVLVVAAILMILWSVNLKSQFADINGDNLFTLPEEESDTLEQKFISVENAEHTDTGLKIFFKIKNPTKNILNFSKADDITLIIDNEKNAAMKLTDRQNQAFVQKILSDTENFGILFFPKTEARTGKLEFDNLFFENAPETIFKEILDLNFDKLNNQEELRN